MDELYTLPSQVNLEDYDHYEHHHRHPNDTCESFAPDEVLPMPFRLIFSAMIALTALISFLLNIFVIFTLILNDAERCGNSNSNAYKNNSGSNGSQKERHRNIWRSKYSNTHLSFISLSIAVILYSSICVPGMYIKSIDNHSKSNFITRILNFGFHVSPIAGSFMHLLMAFDR
mgnify:CR=1 FL=1